MNPELPIRGLGSISAGLVNISQDIRPFTEDEKILTVAVLTSEVTEQVLELRGMYDSLSTLLEEVSRIKDENNILTLQAIEEIQSVQSELVKMKAEQESLNLRFRDYVSEYRNSFASIDSRLSEIRLHQQRTLWRRFKAWITRHR